MNIENILALDISEEEKSKLITNSGLRTYSIEEFPFFEWIDHLTNESMVKLFIHHKDVYEHMKRLSYENSGFINEIIKMKKEIIFLNNLINSANEV